MDLISEIVDNPNKLSNDFDSDKSTSSSTSSNIISIKCTKALFSKEGLKNNISSYILIIFIMQFLLSIILFIKCGYQLLIEEIKKILNEKEKISKQNMINNIGTLTIPTKKKKKKNSYATKKMNFPPKKYNINLINNMKVEKDNSVKCNNNKISNSHLVLNSSKLNNKIRKLNKKSKNNDRKNNNSNNEGFKKAKTVKINSKIKIVYNDFELNSFDYKNAISYDKRTFCQYYLSLLRTKNMILFSFCIAKDYNTMIIKLCLFSLSFSIYYAINFIFFDDKMLHEIYENGGKYEIMYFLPKIAIAFIISYIITTIIKYIFLSERNIYEIRIQPTYSSAYNISQKEKRNLVIKYTIFFILGIIFLVFFWMLLSSFGAVYQNTQMFIFKNALISFSMSLCFPFIIIIFPSIFRICALNSKEKNNECMFKLSKFLQIL